MARVTLGALLNSVAGSLGSATFQNSNAGTILRGKPAFAGNFSQRRQLRRIHNYTLHQAWAALSFVDQAQWYSFANFINIKQKHSSYLNISGQQLFYQLNFYRLIYAKPLLTIPVFSNTRQPDITVTLSIFQNVLFANFSRFTVPSSEFLIIYCTGIISKSVNNFTNKLKIIPFNTPNNDLISLTASYVDIYGATPKTGETVGFQWSLASLTNGLITPFQSAKITF